MENGSGGVEGRVRRSMENTQHFPPVGAAPGMLSHPVCHIPVRWAREYPLCSFSSAASGKLI